MSHDIDYATGVVRLRTPRSCLDRPRWIRVAVTGQLTTPEQVFVDNPQNQEALPSGLTRRLYRAA